MTNTETTFALIDGGVVQNIIVADQAFADLIAADYDDVIECTGNPLAQVVGTYAGGVFVPVPVDAE